MSDGFARVDRDSTQMPMSHRRSSHPKAAFGAEPLVSVVITTCNRPDLLLNAVQSAKNQTYRRTEIIVVDDCSQVDIPSTVLALHRDLTVVRNPSNKGPSYCRNVGIDRAGGEIIAFLDDDDEWLPNKLEEQVSLLREADACLCGYRILESGEIRTHAAAEVTGHDLRRGNLFCGASGLAARRYVFDRIRFDEGLWQGEDWDVYVQIVREFGLRNANKPLFVYRKGGSQSLSNRHFEDESEAIACMLAKLEKNRAFLGEFYFGVRVAGTYLRFFGARSGKGKRILLTMRKAGVVATLYCLSQKVVHRRGWKFSTRRTLHPC